MINNLLSPDFIATLYVPLIISIVTLLLSNKLAKESLFFTIAVLAAFLFSTQYLDSSFLRSIRYQDFVSIYFVAIVCSFTYFAYARISGTRRLFLFLLYFALLIPILILSASAKLAMFSASVTTVLGCYWIYAVILKKQLWLKVAPFFLLSLIVGTLILQARSYAEMSEEVILLLVAAPISLCIGTKEQYFARKYFYYKIASLFCFLLLALGISALNYF